MDTRVIGKGWAFPPRLNDRGRIALAAGEVEINQAIHIILSTAPGERVMRPEFGCRIHEMIFAPANEATAGAVERFVRESLLRWEPRIRLLRVHAEASPSELGMLLIEISYEIKASHARQSLVFPFYLLPEVREAAG